MMPSISLFSKVAAMSFNIARRPLLLTPSVIKYQSAGMLLTSLRDPNFIRPPGFPYKEKEYGLLDMLFDHVIWRFNENSKVIVVDGPPASGKTKVAKEIAEAYDLHYLPSVNLDQWYINDYGYDRRTLNDQMPDSLRSFDIHEFLQNPKDNQAASMHTILYRLKLLQYVEGLSHILNTGQGVVLERSVYGDEVFVDTFTQCGFYPKNLDNYMYKCYQAIFDDLLKPHVVVYLDQSVDVTQKCIKDRNLPGEENSPVYTKEVLGCLEKNYKNYLEKIGKHAEIMVYNWNDERDSQLIIEDLEDVNLDDYAMNDTKMRDWRTEHFEQLWVHRRVLFTNNTKYFERWSNVMDLSCPEVFSSGNAWKQYQEVLDKFPGEEFIKGYNYKQGDPFPYFK